MLYFRHPSAVIDTLPPAKAAQGIADGSLVSIDSLEAVKDTGAFLIAELKVGRGDYKAALSRLIERLERDFSGRYWIDGFSLTMLNFVKSISPATPVTLHTECVYAGMALIGAPEFPPVRLRRLTALEEIDGIAIRRRGGEQFMQKACDDVHGSGKVLILSRLHTLHQFECSKKWGAAAGYMHWDYEDLFAFNDRMDERAELHQKVAK
ncbi:MAG: hypothetical protein ACK5JT_23185 [Hyphomicrobiaceae bacterium]